MTVVWAILIFTFAFATLLLLVVEVPAERYSSVRVASTESIDLSAKQTEIDGVKLELDDLVLLTEQVSAVQDGVYRFQDGLLHRHSLQPSKSTLLMVREGQSNGGVFFQNRRIIGNVFCSSNQQSNCITGSTTLAGRIQKNVIGANGKAKVLVPSGYYDGEQYLLTQDDVLRDENICVGARVFGIDGAATCLKGSTENAATADYILANYEAWNSGGIKITGTMPNHGAWDIRTAWPGSGYYTSPAITTSDYCNTVTIFGTPGTCPCITGSTSNAAIASDVVASKEVWTSAGVKVIGTKPEFANVDFAEAWPGAGYYSGTPVNNSVDASSVCFGTSLFGVSGTCRCGRVSQSISSMSYGLYRHACVALPTKGTILICGGKTQDFAEPFTPFCMIYDPVTETFASTGSMATGRENFAAVGLADGRVIAIGGYGGVFGIQSACELYDPALGTWSVTGSMALGREYHAAVLLPNGKVLVTGGATGDAELYSPEAGTWTNAGAMVNNARARHCMVLLKTGKALVIGGLTSSCELYDYTTDTFTATGSMNASRSFFTATLLANGKVLVVGGDNSTSCELYDPELGTFALTGAALEGRKWHCANLLPDGNVVIMGGDKNGLTINNNELYTTDTGVFSFAEVAGSRGASPVSIMVPFNQSVLLCGGLSLRNSARVYR